MFIDKSVPVPYVFIGRSVLAPFVYWCWCAHIANEFHENFFTKKSAFVDQNLQLPFLACKTNFRKRFWHYNSLLESMQVSQFPYTSNKLEKLTIAVLLLHNWLRSGQSKTVYMPPGLIYQWTPPQNSVIHFW